MCIDINASYSSGFRKLYIVEWTIAENLLSQFDISLNLQHDTGDFSNPNI